MMWSDEIRAELAELLAAYLRGEATVDDVFEFEASVAHDLSLAPDLRRMLSHLALVGDEVGSGREAEQLFRALARATLESLPGGGGEAEQRRLVVAQATAD